VVLLDLLEMVRFECGETTESFFSSQRIMQTIMMRQMEVSAAIGGVTTDGYVVYPLDSDGTASTYEADLPFRAMFVKEADLKQDTIRPLTLRRSRPRVYGTYDFGDPLHFYVVNQEDPKLGLYPGPNPYTITGTISSSGTTVTGTNTLFTDELTIGQNIYADDQLRTIATITSDTALTTTVAFNPALSGESATAGGRVRIRYKAVTYENAYRLKYVGDAEAAEVEVTGSGIEVTTTTSGVSSTESFDFATYDTYGSMKTALETVSGLTVVSSHPDTESIDMEIQGPFNIYEIWGVLFDGIKLDNQTAPLVVRGTVATLRRRDDSAAKANAALAQYYRELKEIKQNMIAKEEPGNLTIIDAYKAPSYYYVWDVTDNT